MSAIQMPTPILSTDQVSYEVEQFCNLLARIYVRCLQEQDPQVINRLTESTSSHEEVKHAAA